MHIIWAHGIAWLKGTCFSRRYQTQKAEVLMHERVEFCKLSSSTLLRFTLFYILCCFNFKTDWDVKFSNLLEYSMVAKWDGAL